ncbi:hypothetical protein D3C72_1778630 [compost metagenome]
MVEVMHQRVWHHIRCRGEEHRRAGHARWWCEKQRIQERLEGHVGTLEPLQQRLPAANPCQHHDEYPSPDNEREPAPFGNFQQAGGNESHIHRNKEAGCDKA